VPAQGSGEGFYGVGVLAALVAAEATKGRARVARAMRTADGGDDRVDVELAGVEDQDWQGASVTSAAVDQQLLQPRCRNR
jgi:hypothetical protein